MAKTNYVDYTKNAPTVLSFCSGYGGIERGLDIAGFKHRVITYVEIEAYAIANLVAKMESNQLDAATIYSDIKTFPSHIFRDKICGITGGYPCQPFSLASGGKRRGNKDPRHLWEYIREHIKTIRPIWCFFENVEGHITLGLQDVIKDLELLGYESTFGIFSASEVGASHHRKRVFILGYASGARFKRRWRYCVSAQSRFSWSTSSSTDFPAKRGSKAYNWENARLKPRMGRADDGYPYKVDRLRLLGNGVVPQTAAKAWLTLNQKLLEQNETRCS